MMLIHRMISSLGYRALLRRNGVRFVYQSSLEAANIFRDDNNRSWGPLLYTAKHNAILNDRHRQKLGSLNPDLVFSTTGIDDENLIAHALKLVAQVPTLADEFENGAWRRFIQMRLFEYFGYFDNFCAT